MEYTDLNPYDKPAHEPRNQTSVTSRYDESHLNRTGNVTVDIYLNESVYDTEWEKAIQLWKDGKIDTILISTWNEYPERTAIGPHIDATAINQDPYFLYNKTKDYITQILLTSPTLEYRYTLAVTAVIFIAVTISVVSLRLRKNNTQKAEKF